MKTAEETREKHLRLNGLSVTNPKSRIGEAIHKSGVDSMNEHARNVLDELQFKIEECLDSIERDEPYITIKEIEGIINQLKQEIK